MRYALLLWADVAAAERTTPAEAEAELSAYARITDELDAAGVLRGGEALLPASTATVVRVEGGRALVETAHPAGLELSGFYLLETDEEQEAVAIAARMPVAAHGAVEVRPVLELP